PAAACSEQLQFPIPDGAPVPTTSNWSRTSSFAPRITRFPSADARYSPTFPAFWGCGASVGIVNAYTIGWPCIVTESRGVLPATRTDATAYAAESAERLQAVSSARGA